MRCIPSQGRRVEHAYHVEGVNPGHAIARKKYIRRPLIVLRLWKAGQTMGLRPQVAAFRATRGSVYIKGLRACPCLGKE